MIIFVEEHEIFRALLLLEAGVGGHHRAASVRTLEREAGQALGKHLGDLAERQLAPGTRRILHEEILAVIAFELIEGLDQEVIDRHPDGTAPIGVAAEEPRIGFARQIADAEFLAVRMEDIRMRLVDF